MVIHNSYLLTIHVLGSSNQNLNKMVAVQVLCGISAVGLRSPGNADLAAISARSFNTLAKWLKR